MLFISYLNFVKNRFLEGEDVSVVDKVVFVGVVRGVVYWSVFEIFGVFELDRRIC